MPDVGLAAAAKASHVRNQCCNAPLCRGPGGGQEDWSCSMMPLGRYFLFIGGSLLALLLTIDWLTPQPTAEAQRTDVDRSTIRIHSAHKWPSAVVFDTTQPTIVPPQQPALAETAAEKASGPGKSPHDALALAQVADVPAAAPAHAAPPKHVKRRVRVAHPAASDRVASSEPFGFRPFFQMGW